MTGKTKGGALQHLPYKSRLWRFDLLRKSEEIVDRAWIGWLATIIFVMIDLPCIYTVFNTVQQENYVMIILISLGCAICLDVPMAYAGNYLKGYLQKIRDKRSTILVLTLAILCFLIIFSFSFYFRIETDYLVFGVNDSSTLTNTLGVAENTVSEQDLKVISIAALFTGILPLCTSLASFLITLYTANPLAARISHYDRALITADAQISDLRQVLLEASKLETHRRNLEEREKDLHTVFLNECDSQCRSRKEAVRLAFMRKTNDPNEINRLIEDGEQAAVQPPAPAQSITEFESYPKMKG